MATCEQPPLTLPTADDACELNCDPVLLDRPASWALALRGAIIDTLTACDLHLSGCEPAAAPGGIVIGAPSPRIGTGKCGCESIIVGMLGWDPPDFGDSDPCSIRYPYRFEGVVSICGYTLDGNDGSQLPWGNPDGANTETVNGATIKASRIATALRMNLGKAMGAYSVWDRCSVVRPERVSVSSEGPCLAVRVEVQIKL